MLTLTEDAQQLRLEYRSRMELAVAIVGMALGALTLVLADRPGVSLVFLLSFAAVGVVTYEHSVFGFDAGTRRVTGRRRHFRKTERFDLPFADMHGLMLEEEGSGQPRYRITLLTRAGPLPLTRVYSSGTDPSEQALRLQAWLQRHGVQLPLQEGKAPRV